MGRRLWRCVALGLGRWAWSVLVGVAAVCRAPPVVRGSVLGFRPAAAPLPPLAFVVVPCRPVSSPSWFVGVVGPWSLFSLALAFCVSLLCFPCFLCFLVFALFSCLRARRPPVSPASPLGGLRRRAPVATTREPKVAEQLNASSL